MRRRPVPPATAHARSSPRSCRRCRGRGCGCSCCRSQVGRGWGRAGAWGDRRTRRRTPRPCRCPPPSSSPRSLLFGVGLGEMMRFGEGGASAGRPPASADAPRNPRAAHRAPCNPTRPRHAALRRCGAAPLTVAGAALNTGVGRGALAHKVVGALDHQAAVAELAAGGEGAKRGGGQGGGMGALRCAAAAVRGGARRSMPAPSAAVEQSTSQRRGAVHLAPLILTPQALAHRSSRHFHSPYPASSHVGRSGFFSTQIDSSASMALGLQNLSRPHHTLMPSCASGVEWGGASLAAA